MLSDGNSNINTGSGSTNRGTDQYSYKSDQPRMNESQLKQIYRTPQLNYGRATMNRTGYQRAGGRFS
jgi:hypothetical protein